VGWIIPEIPSRREDYKISSNLKSTAETLAKIVEYTTKERDETIKTILIYGHPIFLQLAEAIGVRIRVVFSNFDELNTLLKTFSFRRDTFQEDKSTYVYVRSHSGTKTTIRIVSDIFDEWATLKPVERGEWERSFVVVKTEVEEDEIPF
jgi:hypothetical protein